MSGVSVLYEDGELVAVDKPAGIHTAPVESLGGDTLLDRIISRFPDVARVPGMKPVEPGLLHRLDRDTSGVVVAARTASAFAALRAQFEQGRVEKIYTAVCMAPVEGASPGSRLRMESRFAPYGPGRTRVRVVLPGSRHKREVTAASYTTEVEVREKHGGLLLVSAAITKGFRHQVRAHLAALGLPIVGDALYGTECPPLARDEGTRALPAGACHRMYLHASEVRLTHPATGQALVVRSTLPAEFMSLLDLAAKA